MHTNVRNQILESAQKVSGRTVDVEIVKLEAALTRNPNNLDILLQLAELYMQLGKRSKISFYVVASLRQFLASPTNPEKGMITASVAMRFWRAEKYVSKDSLRYLYLKIG